MPCADGEGEGDTSATTQLACADLAEAEKARKARAQTGIVGTTTTWQHLARAAVILTRHPHLSSKEAFLGQAHRLQADLARMVRTPREMARGAASRQSGAARRPPAGSLSPLRGLSEARLRPDSGDGHLTGQLRDKKSATGQQRRQDGLHGCNQCFPIATS